MFVCTISVHGIPTSISSTASNSAAAALDSREPISLIQSNARSFCGSFDIFLSSQLHRALKWQLIYCTILEFVLGVIVMHFCITQALCLFWLLIIIYEHFGRIRMCVFVICLHLPPWTTNASDLRRVISSFYQLSTVVVNYKSTVFSYWFNCFSYAIVCVTTLV